MQTLERAVSSPLIRRAAWAWLWLGLVAGTPACSKARGDAFSRFKPSERLLAPGQAPLQELRYRPGGVGDVVYQLRLKRESPTLKPSIARMRLRVALAFDRGHDLGGPFKLRLLSLLRLDPPAFLGREIGPPHVLLSGHLGPRGQLAELEASQEFASPVNLALLGPLILPQYPKATVGTGGHWQRARRHQWKRARRGSLQTGHARFKGKTELLVTTDYRLTGVEATAEPPRVTLSAESSIRLRSEVKTLSHHLTHQGTAKAKATFVIDRGSGLPRSVTLNLTGSYQLRANDKHRTVTEKVELTLTREN